MKREAYHLKKDHYKMICAVVSFIYRKYSHYKSVKKCLLPFLLSSLFICFKSLNEIVILDKDNLSKYKMQF